MLFGRRASKYRGRQTATFRCHHKYEFLLEVDMVARLGFKMLARCSGDDVMVTAHPTIIERLSWTLDADVVRVENVSIN